MSHQVTFTDTPQKYTPSIGLERSKMLVEELALAAQRDIKNTLHTVDTDAFLNKIFPSNTPSGDIFKKLQKNNSYAGQRWTGFPDNPVAGQEKLLYEPFAAACNAITRAIDRKQVRTKIVYVDRHSTTPHSPNSDMAASRPDGAGASLDAAMGELEKKITDHEDTVRFRTRSEETAHKVVESETSDELDKLNKLYTLWWLQIHVVYEIKNTIAEWYDGVTQLLTYMRQILIEQLDRRFVLGLLLCFNELTVVMCDRSGMMVTKVPINIHDEPQRFIDILAGLSCMQPEDLGWDTTMKIYLPISDKTVPSYEVGPNFQGVYGNTRYHAHWVIDVVVGGKVVKYVTVSIISAIRSAEICGRATVVYEVIKYEERFDPTETLALKRYWRPLERDHPERYPSEGEIYHILDEAPSTRPKYVYASHDIKINRKLDSTFNLIRHGLEAVPFKRPIKGYPTRDDKGVDYEPRQHHQAVPGHARAPVPIPSTLEPVDRCHTNILMPMGEVVRRACSHRELLACFRGFVRDHKDAHSQLILHRDISGGNLLIFTDENGQVFGRLMDYDHAKKAERSLPITRFQHEKLDPQRALSHVREGIAIGLEVNNFLDYEVDDSVALEALGCISDPAGASKYVLDVVETQHSKSRYRPDSSRKLFKADLGWEHDDNVEIWPFYGDREHRKGERTGTLPYMSAEVISRETLYSPPGYKRTPAFVHEVIHDIESFLWVLVHICMTRKGPGINMKRPELDESSENYDSTLRNAIVSYFDGDGDLLKNSKASLLRNPEKFEDEILIHFDSYFEPLKPLVRQWWSILILGYKYRGNEYYNIHSHIIRIIGEALDTIPDTSAEDTTKELKRRKQRLRHYLNTFKPRPTDPSGSTPPSSPPPIVLTTPPDHQVAPQRQSLLDPESPSSRQVAKKRRT
ncbi:hypothetical protein DXG01_003570 [Tephrocybe rancida]|nr:hypothetical protein DXG01_003570 [Tephrocybe rancida]